MIIISFVTMCLAWGFSWFAMKMQVDSFIPLELSVFYRFLATSFLMFILCLITKQKLALSRSEWRFIFIIGLFNFSLNFLLVYSAVSYIPSGVMATIFSLSIIISEIISALIYKRKIERKVIISSILGTIGLAFFILPLIKFGQDSNFFKILIGFFLSLMAAFSYSFGNVITSKNNKVNKTPLYTLIAYASGVGAVFLLILNLIVGNKFIFDSSLKYIFSLSYLVIFASVIAFISLFYMIQKVGSTKANYTSLIYPMIALTTSSYFEGFQFKMISFIGFAMIIIALIIEFMPKKTK